MSWGKSLNIGQGNSGERCGPWASCSLMTPAEKLMWILNNESKEVLCLLGKFIFENDKRTNT
jgi:hypothetical protein